MLQRHAHHRSLAPRQTRCSGCGLPSTEGLPLITVCPPAVPTHSLPAPRRTPHPHPPHAQQPPLGAEGHTHVTIVPFPNSTRSSLRHPRGGATGKRVHFSPTPTHVSHTHNASEHDRRPIIVKTMSAFDKTAHVRYLRDLPLTTPRTRTTPPPGQLLQRRPQHGSLDRRHHHCPHKRARHGPPSHRPRHGPNHPAQHPSRVHATGTSTHQRHRLSHAPARR